MPVWNPQFYSKKSIFRKYSNTKMVLGVTKVFINFYCE